MKSYFAEWVVGVRLSNVVQKVEKLKEKQRESEKELANIFLSLMQQSFRGEL